MGIATETCPNCPLCGCEGLPLYHGLEDRLFHAPGRWNLARCSNNHCRALWLDPMPTQSDIGKAYESYFTHQPEIVRKTLTHPLRLLVRNAYLQGRLGYTQGVGAPWYRHLAPISYALSFLRPAGVGEVELKVSYLSAPQPGMRLLDIGCGNGEQLESMRGYGWSVVGIDTDSRAVAVARERGLDVREGDLETQHFSENQFDAILVRHVIEHVHDPARLLRDCYRILRPGGKLVVETPNPESWGHRRFKASWFPLDPPRHLILFTQASLRAISERCGFTVKRIECGVHMSPLIWQQSLEIQKGGAANFDKPPGLRLWAGGFLFQFAERIMGIARPRAGEELLLIAEKPIA